MNGLTYQGTVQKLFQNSKQGKEEVKALLRNRDTKIQDARAVKLLPMVALEKLRPEDIVIPPPIRYRPLDLLNKAAGKNELGDEKAKTPENAQSYGFLWGVGIIGGLCALGIYATSKKS